MLKRLRNYSKSYIPVSPKEKSGSNFATASKTYLAEQLF
jgi:hypothetical protein